MHRVAMESAGQPEVARLIEELDAYQKPLYPEESHHGIDIDALTQPNVIFAVAREGGGAAIACGALVVEGDWGELKRMYVRPSHRGRGVAQAVLGFLEAQALARGVGIARLETGIRQPEALRFYESAGYARRGPFGRYAPDPNSVFMEKRLLRKMKDEETNP
jgi:putative acetyltransferase